MRIEVVVFPGFDELDAIGPYEALSGAFAPVLVSLGEPAPVTGSHGAVLHPARALSPPDGTLDWLVVPGGGWNDRGPQGAWAEARRGELPRAIGALHAAGTRVAAVCTGAMLLAAAGLLGGRPAVTHHVALGDLRAAGADVVDARVVDDGDIVTAGGVTSGLDLALWLVERLAGPEAAARSAGELEYERRGGVWRRDG
jgi:transcriptional regulator GlxA family with amidase domain